MGTAGCHGPASSLGASLHVVRVVDPAVLLDSIQPIIPGDSARELAAQEGMVVEHHDRVRNRLDTVDVPGTAEMRPGDAIRRPVGATSRRDVIMMTRRGHGMTRWQRALSPTPPRRYS